MMPSPPAASFLIIGAPTVGKSTTSRALAERFERGVHLPVDDLRNMVVAGAALPGDDWTDEVVRQVTLARLTALRMADAYTAAGFTVAIDDFFDSNDLAEYATLAGRPDAHRVILYPSQAEAHRRNRARNGDAPVSAYLDAGIRQVYGWLTPGSTVSRRTAGRVLDTTDLDVAASVDEILAAAAARRSA